MESATRIFEALADDFRWTLLTNRDTARTERWRAGGARVIQFSFDEHRARSGRALQLAQLSLRAALIAARERTTVIHANDIRTAQATIPVARLAGLPFVYTMRDTKARGQTYSATWFRVARYAEALVVLSDEMASLAQRTFDARSSNLHTINSIVDLKAFRPRAENEIAEERKRLGIESKKCSIGIVAAVNEKKGQLRFLQEVMPALESENIVVHFLGDFNPGQVEYARACAEIVSSKGLAGKVKFHGFRTNVADWMAALDLIVVTSENEGLARCMIEAMASGTPVVSFDVCSAREMLEEAGAGLVVQHGDCDGLAQSIVRLAADEEQRKRLGRAGRRAAEARFAGDRVATQWRDVYCGLVRRTKSERAA